MGLISFINGLNRIVESDKEQQRRIREEEMKNYDLSEEEKELVRSGDYEPWSFESWEETDLEEDDYYYNDEA